jgi:FeS assembly SUF system protein
MKEKIIEAIKGVYDPEIPVNIYDLGLIYKIDIDSENNIEIDMTLTAPNCPMVDDLVENLRAAIKNVDDVKNVSINIVFDPPWSPENLSDEVKLDMGLL